MYAASSRACRSARSTSFSAACHPLPTGSWRPRAALPTSSSLPLSTGSRGISRSCAPQPTDKASPPAPSASTSSRSTRASPTTSSSACPTTPRSPATREDMQDLSDDLAANLIAAGAYFSRPYGSWAQPVYNRDAAVARRPAPGQGDLRPGRHHEPRQALLRGADDASGARREGGLTMALTDYRPDAMRCTRCSYCKWIPFDLVKSHRFAKGCPSVEAGKFHAYSAGGKLDHRAQPDGRPQRGHRPGRRHRLPLPALRQLRRGLQALPLRHGADPRAA